MSDGTRHWKRESCIGPGAEVNQGKVAPNVGGKTSPRGSQQWQHRSETSPCFGWTPQLVGQID